jgi:cytochrome c oxidase assembly protein subunit 15
MPELVNNSWRHRFAVLTATATFLLLGAGGLVTSHGAGMAVPDWPNTYGYNMFFFPISKWVGGIFYEHTHRLIASGVGLLTGVLALWLYGDRARPFMCRAGLILIVLAAAVAALVPAHRADATVCGTTGFALFGASFVWPRCEASARWLRRLGFIAFFAVVLQGVLGGLRVVLFADAIGIFHATLAQVFFVLLCAIALFTSKWWQTLTPSLSGPAMEGERALTPALSHRMGEGEAATSAESFLRSSSSSFSEGTDPDSRRRTRTVFPRYWFIGTTMLILLQLILGSVMRHQHADLPIPDFPLAYGRLWPATDPQSVAHYNEQRIEVAAANPITAFQIQLQMAHRILAVLILAGVGWCAWRVRRSRRAVPAPDVAGLCHSPDAQGQIHGGPAVQATADAAQRVPTLVWFWLGLIVVQAGLGALTILSNKAADIATAHVLVGALAFATGVILCIISFRSPEFARGAPVLSGSTAGAPASRPFAAHPATARS